MSYLTANRWVCACMHACIYRHEINVALFIYFGRTISMVAFSYASYRDIEGDIPPNVFQGLHRQFYLFDFVLDCCCEVMIMAYCEFHKT